MPKKKSTRADDDKITRAQVQSMINQSLNNDDAVSTASTRNDRSKRNNKTNHWSIIHSKHPQGPLAQKTFNKTFPRQQHKNTFELNYQLHIGVFVVCLLLENGRLEEQNG